MTAVLDTAKLATRSYTKTIPAVAAALAADGDNQITVEPRKVYTLTDGDSIAGVIGLAQGESTQIVSPSTGSVVLLNDGTVSGDGVSLKLSGRDFNLKSEDESIYTLQNLDGEIRLSGGSASIGQSVLAIPSSGVGGTGDAITLTLTGGPAITDGLTFSIVPSNANTGAVTVNYNGGGALALVDGEGQALEANALLATAPVVIRYTSSGARWRLLSGIDQSPILINNAPGNELAISSGTATPTNASHILASESGTSDTLDNIAASAFPAVGRGHFVIKAGHTITVPTAGNISTTTGNTLTFSGGDILEWWRDEAATGVIVSKHQGGIPTGGSTGDVLVKQSATDFDLDWDAPLSVTEDDGTSLPSFTFETPGNLSVVYGTGGDRIIKYQRVGDWLHVLIDMQWTPTHTTASGNGIITGIPIVSSTARNAICPVYLYSGTPTWPSSGTMVMGMVYTDLGEIRIQSQSSGSNATRWGTTQFSTGTARHVRLSASYPLD